ncbi:MAG TPA: HEPN domain-containing protein [Spirochaetota bacterium]|nr:HEPN domain-containing protein [Spirochaetota bacterium]HPP50352.1 HEPN domain-containing protein [Spirochaetota bacterium]
MTNELLELIEYRKNRALETLEEAKILFNNDRLFATVNRIYYSLFYAVIALLLVKNLSSSKHSGVKGLFNREFIKSGIVPIKYGEFYNKMFDFRQRGDYGDFVEFKKEIVKEWLIMAEEFVMVIIKTIDSMKQPK